MGRVGCKSKGCTGVHRAKGYCTLHYNRARWDVIKSALKRAAKLPEEGVR